MDDDFEIRLRIPASLARTIREDNARRLAEMQDKEMQDKEDNALAEMQDQEDDDGHIQSSTEVDENVRETRMDEEDWERETPQVVVQDEEDLWDEEEDEEEEDVNDEMRRVLLLVNPTLVVQEDGPIDEDAIVRRVDELCSNSLSSLETLFEDCCTTGGCLYTTSDRVARDLERLESRYPVGKWYVLNQYPSKLDSMMSERILDVRKDQESHSLQFIRSCLRNCLRDVRWKCMMMKELEILSEQCQDDSMSNKDKLPMIDEDGSLADDEDEEGPAAQSLNILDQILAMILDRMPPLHHNETNEKRYLRLGKIHTQIKAMWIRDYGSLPRRGN